MKPEPIYQIDQVVTFNTYPFKAALGYIPVQGAIIKVHEAVEEYADPTYTVQFRLEGAKQPGSKRIPEHELTPLTERRYVALMTRSGRVDVLTSEEFGQDRSIVAFSSDPSDLNAYCTLISVEAPNKTTAAARAIAEFINTGFGGSGNYREGVVDRLLEAHLEEEDWKTDLDGRLSPGDLWVLDKTLQRFIPADRQRRPVITEYLPVAGLSGSSGELTHIDWCGKGVESETLYQVIQPTEDCGDDLGGAFDVIYLDNADTVPPDGWELVPSGESETAQHPHAPERIHLIFNPSGDKPAWVMYDMAQASFPHFANDDELEVFEVTNAQEGDVRRLVGYSESNEIVTGVRWEPIEAFVEANYLLYDHSEDLYVTRIDLHSESGSFLERCSVFDLRNLPQIQHRSDEGNWAPIVGSGKF